MRRYLVDVVRLTRTDPAVSLGASPRASLALYRGAQAPGPSSPVAAT